MLLRIERGKLRVFLDAGQEVEQVEKLTEAIGSAKLAEGGFRGALTEVNCYLSVDNLKKLKKLFPSATMSEDETTKFALEKLREQRKSYLAEVAVGNQVKAGLRLAAGYNFKKPPFAHQVKAFSFLHALKSPGCWGDCGVGKTYIVATFAESLMQLEGKWKLLVVCPVNLIKHVWLDDVEKFTNMSAISLRPPRVTAVSGVGVRGEARGPRVKMKREALRVDAFQQEADAYVINPENIRIARKDRKKGDKISLVFQLLRKWKKEGYKWILAIDESSKIKSRTSATYKALVDIREYCDRVVEMTGTPSPNGLLDLWSQFSVLDEGMTLQPSFVDFRHDTHNEIELRGVSWKHKSGVTMCATKWHPRAGSAKQVYDLLSPRVIRFRAEDCIDLPSITPIQRDVEMSKEQQAAYEEMEERLFLELEGEPVTATVAATKMIKLRQITGGFLIDDNGTETPLGADSPKMVELDELLEQSIADKIGDEGRRPNKALVWANYRWECKTLVQRYAQLYGARGLFGGISDSAKDEAIHRFKTDPKARLLICHPASVGHGLTFTDANYAFYYSLSHNYEEFYQSARRIARQGQTRPMFLYFLVCPGTIDEDMMNALREKKNLSDIVTDGKFQRETFLAHRAKRGQVELGWEGANADPREEGRAL